jgi:integrase
MKHQLNSDSRVFDQYREFKAACKAAELGEHWTPRELRHSFVSLMSSSGVPVEEIARLAGHSNSRTTEVIYRRELRPVLTAGADAMDKIFKTTQARASDHKASLVP